MFAGDQRAGVYTAQDEVGGVEETLVHFMGKV